MPTPIRIPKDVDFQSPATISKFINDAHHSKDGAKETQWHKYYEKLYKYKHNLEQGFNRHPRLKKFVDSERKRYSSYAKHRPDRIDKLQKIPGFTWENGECFDNIKVETNTIAPLTTNEILLNTKTELPNADEAEDTGKRKGEQLLESSQIIEQQSQIEAEIYNRNNNNNASVSLKREDDSTAHEITQVETSTMADDSGTEEATVSYDIDLEQLAADFAGRQSQQSGIKTENQSVDGNKISSDVDDQSTQTDDNPLVLLNDLHKRSNTHLDPEDDQSTEDDDKPLDFLKKIHRETSENSDIINGDSNYDTAKGSIVSSQQSQQLENETEDQSVNLTNQLDLDDQSTEADDNNPLDLLNDFHKRSDDKSSTMAGTPDSDAAKGTTIASEQIAPASIGNQSQQSEIKMEDKSDDIKSHDNTLVLSKDLHNKIDRMSPNTMEDHVCDKTKRSSFSSKQTTSASTNNPSHQLEKDMNDKSNDINTYLDQDDQSIQMNDNTTMIFSKGRDNSADVSIGRNENQTVVNQSISYHSKQARLKEIVETSSNKSSRQRNPKRSAPQVDSKTNKKSNRSDGGTIEMTNSAVAKNTRSSKKKAKVNSDQTTNISYRKPITRSSRSNNIRNSSRSAEELAAKPDHEGALRKRHDSFSQKTSQRKRLRLISKKEDKGGIGKIDKKSDKTPKNVVNELQSLRHYFQENLSNHQKDKSFYYGILQKDKSLEAVSIKKLCKKRRYDLNTGVSKGSFSTKLSSLLKEKLAELNDDLVDLLDPEDSEEYRNLSLDEKVSNLIGNYGVTTNLDMFFENMNENVSDLRKYYMSHVSNAKSNRTWYQSTLMNDVSDKGIQLRAFCRDRRRYFTNIFSGKKYSDQYFQKVVQILVSLYDEIEKSFDKSKNIRDKSKQLEDFDKVKCLIGSDEDSKVSVLWVKASDDIRNLENYYVENIISKEKLNTWYNSILMRDASDGANILKDWCRGKRYTMFSDSTHKLKEGPYTDMLRKGLVELHDKLEKRLCTDNEKAGLKSDAEKVTSLVGSFRLEKDNFRCTEYEKFVQKLKRFYEQHKELKNTNNSWFYGVFLSKEVLESVRAPLKFWCLRQRTFFTKHFVREDDIHNNAEFKWKIQLFSKLYDDLERASFRETRKKPIKKSLRQKVVDLIGHQECAIEASFSKRIQNECEQLRLYYLDNVWRREKDESPFFHLLKEDRSHRAVALKKICKQRREYFKRVISEDRCDDRLFSSALKFYEDLYDELRKGRRSRTPKKTRSRSDPHEKLFSILGSGKCQNIGTEGDSLSCGSNKL